ncbi:MAG: hypothetical protein LBE38_03495 [Deltaproteobacteria bacterium]|nr:hypothetical protein [Deltaproteobacteria bacterium]
MPDHVIIAVAQGADGMLEEITKAIEFSLCKKEEGAWVLYNTMDFNFSGSLGLCQMRQKLVELIKLLQGAVAIIAKGFPGISRDVLTRAGFSLYQLEEFNVDVLDGVVEHLSAPEEEELIPKAPYEMEEGSGKYFLNISETLNAFPELTTKKILRPFMDSRKFLELKIIYDHLPPWLPLELKNRKLSWDSKDVKGGVLVNIFPEGKCHD